MRLVGLVGLAAATVTQAVDINWQKVGQCGVPSKRPNSNLFEGIDARSASANGNAINKDLTRVVGGQEANPHSLDGIRNYEQEKIKKYQNFLLKFEFFKARFTF